MARSLRSVLLGQLESGMQWSASKSKFVVVLDFLVAFQ